MIVIIMLHEITVGWNGKIKANKRLSSFGDAANNVYGSNQTAKVKSILSLRSGVTTKPVNIPSTSCCKKNCYVIFYVLGLFDSLLSAYYPIYELIKKGFCTNQF